MAEVIPFPGRTKSKGKPTRIRRKPIPQGDPDFFPYLTPEDLVSSTESIGSHTSVDEEQAMGDLLSKYRHLPDGPFLFMEDWLGINPNPWPGDCPPEDWDGRSLPLWSKQREILEALFTHKKVTVKSGHGVGKTRTAAIASQIMLYVFRALTITTAPTFRQVKRALWGEIHSIHNHANKFLFPRGQELGGKLNTMDLQLGPKWYAIGFSTDDPDFFQGLHEERVFLVVDEACGWPKELYVAAEGILTSEDSYVLLIGNPTDPTGEFAESFRPGSEYHPITISCYDSPNVRHQQNIYRKIVAPGWPDQKKKKWGENSPMFKARVLAEFPEEREDTLIPLRYIQAALDRELPEDAMVISYGLDVARFGDDSSVMGRRRANGHFRFVWEEQGKTTTRISGHAQFTWQEECLWEKEGEEVRWEAPINVDDIGVGGGVTDQLMDEGLPANGINVAEAGYEVAEDDEHPEMFVNQRAQYFWRLRQAFVKGEVDIDDEELAEQLSHILYDYQSGKIRIQKKEDYKKLYGHSPDKADCMMLAWARAEFEEGGRALGGWL